MQLISKYNKKIQFLFARVVPLKNKKRVTVTNDFQKTRDESDRKSREVWVDKGSDFYNISMK